jgi:hypothetical protein
MSKQLLLALGAGGAATAAVVASAATLGTVDSTDLGAGNSVIASCDTTAGISVSYTTTFATGDYKVSTVTLGDLDAACVGQAVKITLYGSGGTSRGTASGTVVDDSDDFTVAALPLAEDVTGVAVVISG